MYRLWLWLTGARRRAGWSLASTDNLTGAAALIHDVCGRNYLVADLSETEVLTRSHRCRPLQACGATDGPYGTCSQPVGHWGRHAELRDGQLWAEWSGPRPATPGDTLEDDRD